MKTILITHIIGLAMAWAASPGSTTIGPIPVFALLALLAFALQWLAFIPANAMKTEKFYDLTGSLTYILIMVLAVTLSGPADLRSQLLAGFVLVWALRLGSFLFVRIHQDGADTRFDKIKPDPIRFLGVWCLQGLWVLLTASAALAAITSITRVELGITGYVGCALWLAGFAIEVVADHQKRVFRKQQGPDAFITTGLWALSRHPNYLGEILLWLGIAVLALPALSGWQYAVLVSPLFVYVLLTRISGVPLLERKADKRWGEQADYQAYKARTAILVPGFGGGQSK